MSVPITHNLENHWKGDTFDGESFHLEINGDDADLTDAVIRMDVRDADGIRLLRLDNGTEGGITITDAAGGVFAIDGQVIDIAAGDYTYDIEIEFDSGVVKTYVTGSWSIKQDVTYGEVSA